MSHTPHELAEEFPQHLDRIHTLNSSDPRFANLSGRYHKVNREIHRGETNVEPMDDCHLEELKKTRLAILDEIAKYLH